MLYHQSEKTKNDHKHTVLKKIKDKYSYDGSNVQTLCEDVEICEDVIYIYILLCFYEIEDDMVVLCKESKYE
jgi:hypothetical protein